MAYELRPYQNRCIEDVRAAFASGNRSVLLTSPVASGKTIMFAHVAAGVHRNNKSALILAHRKELVFQVCEKLQAMRIPHGTILGGQPGIPRKNIIAGSVQTVVKRLRHMPAPSLIIPDEAHRACADSAFGQIIAAFPEARVLGVSASPQRTDRKPLDTVFDTLVQGPTVAELIAGGWLPPPEVYAPITPDLSMVSVKRGDFVTRESEAAMDRPFITGHATQHYKKLAPGKRAIVFCVSIAHAEHVAEEFRRAGFEAAHIDGTMTDYERARRLREFASGRLPILTTVDLCNEGLDIPGIEAAILLRPTESVIVHIQQMGRAMRPAPGKSRAIIIDACGNVGRHGLPDAPRVWSLQGEVKPPAEKVPRVMTCAACFACYPPARVCPRCGAAPEVKARKVDQVDGELGLVTSGAEYDIGEDSGDTLKDMTRQYYTLRAIAKQRGYDAPDAWAFKIVSARLAAKKSDASVDELAAATIDRDRVQRAMSREDPVSVA